MMCGRSLPTGRMCTYPLGGGPRHWRCPDGHEWWGALDGPLSSTPWPQDRPPRRRWWHRLRRHR